MKKLAISFIILASLAGCASKGGVKPEAVVVIEKQKRTPPAEAMVACPSLGQLDDDTFGAVVRKLGEVSEAYKLCEQKRKELKDFIEGEIDTPPSKN